MWSPKTEEDREKELVILDFLAESRQRHLLPNHETDWSGDASQRQYMLIVIQNGSNLVNIDLAQDDIVGEGPFNMVFSDGCLFPSRGYLLTPGEIRTFVERTLDDANYTVSSCSLMRYLPMLFSSLATPPSMQGSYNKDFGYKGQVFSPKYKQSTQNLSKEARQVFTALSAPQTRIK